MWTKEKAKGRQDDEIMASKSMIEDFRIDLRQKNDELNKLQAAALQGQSSYR
jgi:hypothetical protein